MLSDKYSSTISKPGLSRRSDHLNCLLQIASHGKQTETEIGVQDTYQGWSWEHGWKGGQQDWVEGEDEL